MVFVAFTSALVSLSLALAGAGGTPAAGSRLGGPERAPLAAAGAPRQGASQGFDDLLRDGVQRMERGDFAGALERFHAALDLRPGDLQASFLLGTAQRGAGDLEGATETFERISAAYPGAPSGPFGLGQVQLLQGDPVAAEQSLREALARAPDYTRAWFYLGEALRAQGLDEQAAAAYREALRRNPEGRPSALALARILMERDEPAQALEVLRAFAASAPPDPLVVALTSRAQALLGRFDEALATLDAAGARGAAADDWFNVALAAARSGDWGVADRALARALQADPTHEPARLLLSEMLEQGGRPQQAEQVLQQGIGLTADNAVLRRALAALYINRNAGQMSEAAEILRQLLAESPDDDGLRRALATVYADTGQIEPALELFAALGERYPDDPEIAYRIGYLQSHEGDNEAARAALERALELDPDNIDAAYELGVIDMREQRHADSVARLEKVVQAQPYRTGAWVNLARALRGVGREQEAQEAAQRARELQVLDGRIEELRTQVRLHPTETGNYVELARLLAQNGNDGEAVALLRTALRIDPELREAIDLLQQIGGR